MSSGSEEEVINEILTLWSPKQDLHNDNTSCKSYAGERNLTSPISRWIKNVEGKRLSLL